MIYECKSIYEGEWKKGMKHGNGCLKSFNLTISGEWENNILKGFSKMEGNGFEYEGIVSAN